MPTTRQFDYWVDGAPVIQFALTGGFDYWVDGASVIQIEPTAQDLLLSAAATFSVSSQLLRFGEQTFSATSVLEISSRGRLVGDLAFDATAVLDLSGIVGPIQAIDLTATVICDAGLVRSGEMGFALVTDLSLLLGQLNRVGILPLGTTVGFIASVTGPAPVEQAFSATAGFGLSATGGTPLGVLDILTFLHRRDILVPFDARFLHTREIAPIGLVAKFRHRRDIDDALPTFRHRRDIIPADLLALFGEAIQKPVGEAETV